MKIFIYLLLLSTTLSVTANGEYKIHEKHSISIEINNGTLNFSKFKSSLNGKLSGYIQNNSPNNIKWVWFDFERFDKKGVKTTVSKSYPQLLFEEIPSMAQNKIKGISMIGVKWLKSFNFGEIIGIEYDKNFYIQYANNLSLPILIKSVGLKYNKRLYENEIFLNWINTGNAISNIAFSFEGVSKAGDPVKEEPILSSTNTDGASKGEEKNDVWSSWNSPLVSCPKLYSVKISYLNGEVLRVQGSDLNKLVYSPPNNLYPNQSIEILNCMNLKLYKLNH